MSFGEDRSRPRLDHAQANLGVLRRMGLSLLKNETSSKVGIKNRRLTAAWNTDYLHKVLFGVWVTVQSPPKFPAPSECSSFARNLGLKGYQ